MTLEEFVKKDKEAADKVLKCENIDELNKLAIENNIELTEGELKKISNYISTQNCHGELDDDALESVAGGKGDSYVNNSKNVNLQNANVQHFHLHATNEQFNDFKQFILTNFKNN